MLRWLEHLFSHLLQRFIRPDELVAGVAMAFALWCLDHAVIEFSRRRGYTLLLLGIVAAVVCCILSRDWEAGAILRIGFVAVLVYVPYKVLPYLGQKKA